MNNTNENKINSNNMKSKKKINNNKKKNHYLYFVHIIIFHHASAFIHHIFIKSHSLFYLMFYLYFTEFDALIISQITCFLA